MSAPSARPPAVGRRRTLGVALGAVGLVAGGSVAGVTASAAPADADLFAPTAAATATPSTVEVGDPVTLSGTASTDGDLDLFPMTYDWGFGDGTPHGTGEEVTHTYASTGLYTAVLTVTDVDGLSDTANVPVTVIPVDEDPTAAMSLSRDQATRLQPISFSASGSTDLESPDDLTYSWSFGDGGSAAGENVEHAYDADGTYTVTVRVTDPRGQSDVEQRQVTITPAVNTAPWASASYTPGSPLTDEAVTFSATASGDDETPASLTYAWSFDDGTHATGAEVSHAFETAGSHTGTVTVTDPAGATDTDTVSLTVIQRDERAPRARLLVSPVKPYAGRTQVRLSGELSSDDNTPTSQLAYSWVVDGPEDVTSQKRRWRHEFAKPGRYRVTLSTTDLSGNSSSISKRYRVWRWRDCQDTTRRIQRSGGWRTVAGAGADRDHCRGQAGSTFRYTFTGPRLEIRLGRSTLGGKARLSVDGERRKRLSFHGDGSLRFGKTRVLTGLGKGKHTLRLETRGGLAFLDSLISRG